MSQEQEETLIEFPARFPVKIMGKNTAAFQQTVSDIVNQFIAEKDCLSVTEKPSKNGNYLAISVTAMFYDKPSIDAFYQALSDAPDVLMAL